MSFKGKWLQYASLVAFGVAVYALLTHLDVLFVSLQYLFQVLVPILIGAAIAFVLHIPLVRMESLLSRVKPLSQKPVLLRFLSLLVTIVGILLILALVIVLVIPNLVSAVKEIALLTPAHLESISPALYESIQNSGLLLEWQNNTDLLSLLFGSVTQQKGLLSALGNAVTSVFGTLGNILLGIVIACYLLMNQETLKRQYRKVLRAYFPHSFEKRIDRFAALMSEKFSKFFTGQLAEAVILGILMFFAFAVARLPYASLIAVLTAVTSLIPYIGAFLACAVGALIIVIQSPTKAIISIIVFQLVQQIENRFIYPHVVGKSVGLSAFWTMIAIILGGKLFGLTGMILFIPLMAVIYTLVREDANQRILRKQALTEGKPTT